MTEIVSEDWQLINRKTGEIRDIVLFEGKRDKWQKVYAKSLASMLELTGDQQTHVVAYLIKVKYYDNTIHETVRSVANATGVSPKTVHRTFKILQDNNYLHKIRNGQWRFSPHVMVNGKAAVGAAVFRSWKEEDQ